MSSVTSTSAGAPARPPQPTTPSPKTWLSFLQANPHYFKKIIHYVGLEFVTVSRTCKQFQAAVQHHGQWALLALNARVNQVGAQGCKRFITKTLTPEESFFLQMLGANPSFVSLGYVTPNLHPIVFADVAGQNKIDSTKMALKSMWPTLLQPAQATHPQAWLSLPQKATAQWQTTPYLSSIAAFNGTVVTGFERHRFLTQVQVDGQKKPPITYRLHQAHTQLPSHIGKIAVSETFIVGSEEDISRSFPGFQSTCLNVWKAQSDCPIIPYDGFPLDKGATVFALHIQGAGFWVGKQSETTPKGSTSGIEYVDIEKHEQTRFGAPTKDLVNTCVKKFAFKDEYTFFAQHEDVLAQNQYQSVVRLWDTRTQKPGLFTHPQSRQTIYTAICLASETTLCIATEENPLAPDKQQAHLLGWDIRKPTKFSQDISPQGDKVISAMEKVGDLIYTGSSSSTLRSWSANLDPVEMHVFPHDHPKRPLVFPYIGGTSETVVFTTVQDMGLGSHPMTTRLWTMPQDGKKASSTAAASSGDTATAAAGTAAADNKDSKS